MKKSILVIDDVPNTQPNFESHFPGSEVVCVTGYAEALDCVREKLRVGDFPDVIVTDIHFQNEIMEQIDFFNELENLVPQAHERKLDHNGVLRIVHPEIILSSNMMLTESYEQALSIMKQTAFSVSAYTKLSSDVVEHLNGNVSNKGLRAYEEGCSVLFTEVSLEDAINGIALHSYCHIDR
jgi:CheY-like chemotaxis protein